METIAKLPSRSIFQIIMPTFKAFYPLLVANQDAINAVKHEEFSYGSHSRQKCDIYPSKSPKSDPVLVFFYGGGLTRGDKQMPPQADPARLVYNNLGAFFALQGFTTVVADYRRVNDKEAGTGEDATFPSGGDDFQTVLEYLTSEKSGLGSGSQKRDLYLMGNSAGGIHLATFLLNSKYLELRKKLTSGATSLTLKGAVLLSVPFDMDSSGDARKAVNQAYWPLSLSSSPSEIEEKAEHSEHSHGPAGLLRSIKQGSSQKELGIPATTVVEGELDPADEITDSIHRFEASWKEKFGGGLDHIDIKGHNHISPPLALMSGDEGQKWGLDVVGWMKKQA